MNGLDLLILALLLVAALMGLGTGIIKMGFLLAGLIAGIYLAGRYSDTVAGWLTFIEQAQVARLLAFVLVVVLVEGAASFLSGIVQGIASMLMLGWLNRIIGAAVGLLIGATVISALVTIWVRAIGMTGPVADSALAKLLVDRFPLVMSLLPAEFDSIRSLFR